MLNDKIFEKQEVFGNIPLPRFGHTITRYDQNKVCLFGGATGHLNQLSITDNTYTFDMLSRLWKKVQVSGTSPSPRAAHAAVCIETNKIILYGGATKSGGLASDDLFYLDIKEEIAIWTVINTKQKTPGKRYGHSLSFSKPYLIVFAGNIGNKAVNDCWILNIKQIPLIWEEVQTDNVMPLPRVYHSASVCPSGVATGMIVIFGGRSINDQPLNDCWGLKRRRTGAWDWQKAPDMEESELKPTARYQHSSLFVGSSMIISGGRVNNVTEKLPLQIFDTETNLWKNIESIQRFRHGSWSNQKYFYVYGGFQLTTPNIPTDSIMKISLSSLLGLTKENLNNTSTLSTAIDSPLNNVSPKNHANHLQNSKNLNYSVSPAKEKETIKQKKQNGQENKNMKRNLSEVEEKNKDLNNSKLISRTRARLMEPVIGNEKNKVQPNLNRKKITSREEIPTYFLDALLQPNNFMNADAIDINFKSQHIIALCDIAEEILRNQPIILRPKTPLKVFGDIHGQFTDLMSFFALYGAPHLNGQKKDIENYDYVFLGDYVDRGSHCLETILLLLALKCVYPDQIHLIRGNHEDKQININFGFSDECSEKLGEEPGDESSVFHRINKLFEWLPLAAIIEDKILCIHGGIGASLTSISDIEKIKRPLEVLHEVVDVESQHVLDILWSDPTESDSELGIHPNVPRDPTQSGNIVKFGPDRVQDFLKQNQLEMIIRAHQCVMDGFQRFAGGALITLFSATDYCKRHKNAGAILIIKTNFEIIPKSIYPSSTNSNNWIEDEEQLRNRPPTPPRWRNQQRN